MRNHSDGMADISELFTHSCPKFVAAAPSADDAAGAQQHGPEWAPYTLQLKLFLNEVPPPPLLTRRPFHYAPRQSSSHTLFIRRIY